MWLYLLLRGDELTAIARDRSSCEKHDARIVWFVVRSAMFVSLYIWEFSTFTIFIISIVKLTNTRTEWYVVRWRY